MNGSVDKFKHIRFLGAAGIGMTALINIIEERKSLGLLDKNLKISRSDLSYKKNDPVTEDIDLVVVSTAIPQDDKDLIAIKNFNKEKPVEIWHRSDMLNVLSRNFKQIVISGTHGKTTCTAMVAHILSYANLDPNFAVGGILIDCDCNGKAGRGEYFVLEGDESDKSFTKTSPYIAQVTSIEPDHLENYPGGLEEIKSCFFNFLDSAEKQVLCLDDPLLVDYSAKTFSLKPGKSTGPGLLHHGVPHNDVYTSNILTYSSHDKSVDFYIDLETSILYVNNFVNQLNHNGLHVIATAALHSQRRPAKQSTYVVNLKMHGKHNLINAAGAIATCCLAGVPVETSIKALMEFGGIKRRFELINANYQSPYGAGDRAKIAVYDDYAHHPTEVQALLNGALGLNPKRLVFVYQPHHPERTKQLWEDFKTVFKKFPPQHLALIADIYVARTAHLEGVNSERLVNEIANPSVKYLRTAPNARKDSQGNYVDIVETMKPLVDRELQEGDILVIAGAGNIAKLAAAFQK